MMMWTLSPWLPPTIQLKGWLCGHCHHDYHLQYSPRDDDVDTVTMITTYNTAQGMMMWTLSPWFPPTIQPKGWWCGHCHHDYHLQYSSRDDDVDTVTMITTYNTAQGMIMWTLSPWLPPTIQPQGWWCGHCHHDYHLQYSPRDDDVDTVTMITTYNTAQGMMMWTLSPWLPPIIQPKGWWCGHCYHDYHLQYSPRDDDVDTVTMITTYNTAQGMSPWLPPTIQPKGCHHDNHLQYSPRDVTMITTYNTAQGMSPWLPPTIQPKGWWCGHCHHDYHLQYSPRDVTMITTYNTAQGMSPWLPPTIQPKGCHHDYHLQYSPRDVTMITTYNTAQGMIMWAQSPWLPPTIQPKGCHHDYHLQYSPRDDHVGTVTRITTYNTAQGMSSWLPPTIQPKGWWCGHCYHDYHLQYSQRDDDVDIVTMITTYNIAQGMMMWTVSPWLPPTIQPKGRWCGHCHHDDHLQYSPRDDDVDTVTIISNTAQEMVMWTLSPWLPPTIQPKRWWCGHCHHDYHLQYSQRDDDVDTVTMITTYNTAQGMMMWTLSPWLPPTIQPKGWWCGHCHHDYHLQYSSRDDDVDTVTMITTYNTAQGTMMWTL